jgi:hypothetical protein
MADVLTQSTTGNLPVELTSFVGRERELSGVRRLLSTAHSITLTGWSHVCSSPVGSPNTTQVPAPPLGR